MPTRNDVTPVKPDPETFTQPGLNTVTLIGVNELITGVVGTTLRQVRDAAKEVICAISDGPNSVTLPLQPPRPAHMM